MSTLKNITKQASDGITIQQKITTFQVLYSLFEWRECWDTLISADPLHRTGTMFVTPNHFLIQRKLPGCLGVI